MRIGAKIGMLKERDGAWFEAFAQVPEIALHDIALDMYERVERKGEVDAVVLLGEAETVIDVKLRVVTCHLRLEPLSTVGDALLGDIVSCKRSAMRQQELGPASMARANFHDARRPGFEFRQKAMNARQKKCLPVDSGAAE